MKAIYHILKKAPAIYKEDMQIELEKLAQQLVSSGRMRIDTDYNSNFITYSDPNYNIHIFFSHEELTNAVLMPIVEKTIKNHYKIKNKIISDAMLSTIVKKLKGKAQKLFLVSAETKIRLARVLVQSAHPIIIRWLLLDKAQIFITYSNSIGDVMSIQDWKRSGNNSGMQSTDGSNICIYVSCGGDPFAKNSETNPEYGNGWAALARMQIIAGQEIGHYADIKRDEIGRQIGRFSANFACTMANRAVKDARKKDELKCIKIIKILNNNGLSALAQLERKEKFYKSQKLANLSLLFIKLRIIYYKIKLMNFAKSKKYSFIKQLNNRYTYLGTTILGVIHDTLTHLSPQADVYKRADKDAEEAIKCVEALARVPQQVNKLGFITTRALMPNLYKIYYKEIIPSAIENYTKLTGKKYKRSFEKYNLNFIEKIQLALKLGKFKNKHKFTEITKL